MQWYLQLMANDNWIYKFLVCPCAENKFTSIGPIYYEYGSMVITYEDANKAVRALYALRDAKHEDKPLLGKCFDKVLDLLLVAK